MRKTGTVDTVFPCKTMAFDILILVKAQVKHRRRDMSRNSLIGLWEHNGQGPPEYQAQISR